MDTPLKRARERRGLKHHEVAAAVGIGRSQYTRIEGRSSGASLAVAKRLAEFFGAPLTRDQILFPEEYIGTGARMPVRPVPDQTQLLEA